MIIKTKNLPDTKDVLKKLPVVHYLEPEFLYFPIVTPRCVTGDVCVIEGQKVKVGDVIGTREGSFFEQNIHATCSGEIVAQEKHFDSTGKKVNTIVIKNDFNYTLADHIQTRSEEEIKHLKPSDMIEIVKDLGLVGLGGGGFPTYIKLKLRTEQKVNVVIANGVECEPELISDYGLMMDSPKQVIKGLIYAMQTVGCLKGVIAIKEKNEELYKRLEFTLKEFSEYDIKVARIGNYYPQGWETEVIKNVTGIDVKHKTLPIDYGVINLNVSTLASIYQAIKHGLPLLERRITISGNAVENMTFIARIGTMISDLVETSGGYKNPEVAKVMVIGGPMMGANVRQDDVPMTHTTTSFIVNDNIEYQEEPCVRCASCVYSCPVALKPVQIMNAFKEKDVDMLKTLKVDYCISCGLCSYVCPSKIPLTDIMKSAKNLLLK